MHRKLEFTHLFDSTFTASLSPVMIANNIADTLVMGKNLISFMQGYITCDLAKISEEVAVPMAITDIKGRVVANGWVCGDETALSLLTHDTVVTNLNTHLEPYLRFGRCEISDCKSVYVSRARDKANFILQIGSYEFGLSDNSTGAIDLDMLQLETGYPLVTDATTGQFLPQMLDLTAFGAVSFDKGCYLGQEVVARAEHRGQVKRRLRRVLYDGLEPAIGATVKTQHGDKATVIACHLHSALVVTSADANESELRLVAETET